MKSFLVGCSLSAVVLLGSVAQAQQAIARWNFGENDAGATAGGAGSDVTVDSVGTRSLTKYGAPT